MSFDQVHMRVFVTLVLDLDTLAKFYSHNLVLNQMRTYPEGFGCLDSAACMRKFLLTSPS